MATPIPALPIGGHWQFFHGVQQISYHAFDGTNYASEETNPVTAYALKRMDTKRLKTGNLKMRATEHQVHWSIWKDTFSTPTIPKRGDKFTATTVAGSVTWIIKEVDYCDFTTRYRCLCYQEGNGA